MKKKQTLSKVYPKFIQNLYKICNNYSILHVEYIMNIRVQQNDYIMLNMLLTIK